MRPRLKHVKDFKRVERLKERKIDRMRGRKSEREKYRKAGRQEDKKGRIKENRESVSRSFQVYLSQGIFWQQKIG
jgi:hypothetical protein